MWVKAVEYAKWHAELAALQERVKALTEQVADLKAREKDLQAGIETECKRADNAVDRLLNSKGFPGVAPPPKPPSLDELSDMFEEQPDEVQAIRERIAREGVAEVLLAEAK